MADVKLSLGIKGLAETERALELYAKKLVGFYAAALQQAGNDGAVIADGLFHNFIDHADQKHSVNVKAVSSNEDGNPVCTVRATGKAVVFLEFGAGDTTGYGEHGEQMANFEAETGIPIEAGQYSAFDGTGEYAKNGYWFWNNIMFRGVYPRRGMYSAMQDMTAELANPNSQSYEDNKHLLEVK